jgi:hypothetical protein
VDNVAIITTEGNQMSTKKEEKSAAKTAMKPGLYKGIENDAYHSGPGISKSGLWTVYQKSPLHFKNPPVKKETPQSVIAKEIGSATHLAILEPAEFEAKVVRGPDDRRGNKWKDRKAVCDIDKKLLLTSSDYDEILAIRDAVHADEEISNIILGNQKANVIEASGYWIDEETGLLCRCRPDLFRTDHNILFDVKTTADARKREFMRSVFNFGYHAQEAFYSDGLFNIGKAVNGFLFLALEKERPYANRIYELPPSFVEEGRAIMRKALDTYAASLKANSWAGYGSGVEELEPERWMYKETLPPQFGEEEAA